MTGVINKTARQLDLRGRDASGIVQKTLNPGFNVVDDETWKVLMENKHNSVLVDEGAIIAGTKKTKSDEDLEREALARDAQVSTREVPEAAAGVVATETSKDPNINPETGKAWTKAQLKAKKAAGADLELE